MSTPLHSTFRGNQYPTQLGVEGLSGLKRLEAQSTSFCSHQQTLGSPRDRPVCQSFDQATSQFCGLETRPRSPGNRCIRPRLEPMEEVCFPPIFIDRTLPQKSRSTAGRATSNCNTSLASTSMVSFTSGILHRLPSSTSTGPLPFDERSGSTPTRPSPLREQQLTNSKNVDPRIGDVVVIDMNLFMHLLNNCRIPCQFKPFKLLSITGSHKAKV